MEFPLISYVVVTMDRKDELAGCLASLAQQDYPRIETIVVDNGSTDGTASWVAREHPEVRLVALEENTGPGGARNRGIEEAQGDICILIDDDARLADAQAAQRAVDYFEADRELAALAFKIKNAFTGAEDRKGIPRRDKRTIEEDYACSYFCGGGFAIRREVFLRLGGFWARLMYGGEELDFSYRLLDAGYRILHSTSVEVLHREVALARPKGQYIYSYAKNRCWIAFRNLPWRHAVSTALLWWLHTGLVSVATLQVGDFARGVRDCMVGLREARRSRQCISRQAVALLGELSGRKWY